MKGRKGLRTATDNKAPKVNQRRSAAIDPLNTQPGTDPRSTQGSHGGWKKDK